MELKSACKVLVEGVILSNASIVFVNFPGTSFYESKQSKQTRLKTVSSPVIPAR